MYSDEDISDNDNNICDKDLSNLGEELITVSSPKSYTVLTMDDIRSRQNDDVAAVSTVLSITRSAATILLLCHRWNQASVFEAWFSDESKVRKSAGLQVHYEPHFVKEFECQICFEKCFEGAHAGCGHMFCFTCYESYIHVAIEDGPGCLALRCPDISCDAAVDQDLVGRLGSDLDKDKYRGYLIRSYIENNLKMNWCPASGCDMVVEFDDDGTSGYDVLCLCSHKFCWKCQQEAHRPVDCHTVAKWISKSSVEWDSVDWIQAFTKACPMCKKPIEKNMGCMHMTCTAPCNYEFCWLCLRPWHGRRHNNACNRYEQEVVGHAENERETGQHSLNRYSHYYKRWLANEKSREKASEDLLKLEEVNLNNLGLILSKPVSTFQFVTDAFVQIIECRRALKWSYAYGYFIPDEEKAKRNFFEYLQGEAESNLERLHQYAERNLNGFLERVPREDFNQFSSTLIDLTCITQTYFENLVKALENGLSDVGPSNSNKGNGKGKRNPKQERDFSDLNEQGNQKRQRR